MSAPTPARFRRLWMMIVLPWLAMACGASPPAAPPATPTPALAASPPSSIRPGVPAESAGAPSGEPEATDRAAEPPLMPIGVPECDNFIKRYVACVEQRVPPDQKAKLMDDLNEHHAKWRELSRLEQGKLAVGLSCRSVAQRLKGDLTVDFGCEF